MADYNANIKVNADTRQAESQLKKLQNSLDKLSDISTKVNLQSAQQQFNKLGTTLRGIGERGALGAITLGAGKAAASIGGLGAKFGILGAAAASAGATINGALGGVPGVITDILAQVGNIPNAFGLAAVAAMAFAPQILKASSATVGLGAAIDKAVGKQTTEKIANVVDNLGRLNVELDATKATFAALVEGSTLNQLNNQLKDAVKESGAFHSSTEEAVVAAEQLVTVQKEQRREQKAITDLIRQAQGLQPQDVRDTEVSRRVALLKSREVQQKKDLQLQNQINAELAEYERLAAEVANQTKQWANNLDRIARSSRAGVLGSQSQLQARVQEFRENRRSAEIARQRSAELAARERQLAGGQYSLAQVPAGGELFPGGRTETAANQYRSMLNEQARIQQAAATALQRSEKTLIGLQAQTLRTEKDITAAKRQQQSIDERSIQLIREQNKLLLAQYRAEQRVAAGTLDPASLRADRMRRVEQGRAQQKRSREMTENVIIGGAFPMLFGGGPGAVIGGAAGGLIPGNPMLSVATSALGALLDQFATSVMEMGASLRDPITNFQKLADAGLIASRSQQVYIQRLIEAGRVTEAAAAIQAEVVNKIGAQGVKDLQDAGAASSMFNKQLAELNLQMQAAVAGPLTDMLRWLNQFLASVTSYNRQQAAQTDFLTSLREANPQAYQQYFRESMQLRAANRGVVDPTAIQRLQQQYTQRYNLQPGAVTSSIDKTPEMRAQAQTQELQSQVTLESKKLSLVGMSLEKNGQAYVEAAKAVALQEYENKLLEIKNSWIGQAFDLERNQAMIRLANLQYAGKLKAIDAERVKTGRDELEIRRAILGLQSDLIRTTLEAGDLDVEYERVSKGQAAAIGEELKQLQARLELEGRSLNLRMQQQLLTKDLTAQERSLIETIYKEQLNNLTQQYRVRQQTLVQTEAQLLLDKALADAEAIRQAKQPFEELRRQRELELQYGKTYLRLVTEGLLPAEAERIANFERLVSEQLNALDNQIAITQAALIQAEAYGVSADKIKELRDELERLRKARGATVDEAAKGPGEGAKPGDRIKEAVATARGELNELLDLENQVIAAAAAIGDAFQQAFKGLVSGAMTGQEALAAFFKGVGDHFLDMATMMIAKLIEIYILETVLGFITGAATGSAPRGTPGAKAPNGKPYYGPAFAEGGFVTGPTRALIGEGGEPEYVIPASKMRTAMGRYSAGARGSSVVSGTGGQVSGETNGSAATMEPIDVRYSVERINNVDYVTADQFQRGMAQAAQQGAIQGERRAMRTLQNSAATRRRISV